MNPGTFGMGATIRQLNLERAEQAAKLREALAKIGEQEKRIRDIVRDRDRFMGLFGEAACKIAEKDAMIRIQAAELSKTRRSRDALQRQLDARTPELVDPGNVRRCAVNGTEVELVCDGQRHRVIIDRYSHSKSRPVSQWEITVRPLHPVSGLGVRVHQLSDPMVFRWDAERRAWRDLSGSYVTLTVNGGAS